MSRPNYFGESFANMQKNENDTKQLQFLSWAEDTKLELEPPHACHKFTCFNLVQVFAAHLSVWIHWAKRSHWDEFCKFFSRLHHIIVVLCQVLLSSTRNLDFFGLTPVNICCVLSCSRDLFQVYITFYYFYPQLILVQHFANVPSSLDQKEIFRSHFWAFGLHWDNILFLISPQPQVAVGDLFCLMLSFEEEDGQH